MTIESIYSAAIKQAVIYMKNGGRKYGMLIDSPLNDDCYQFISNDNIAVFQETYSARYIELIASSQVEAIDKNLK